MGDRTLGTHLQRHPAARLALAAAATLAAVSCGKDAASTQTDAVTLPVSDAATAEPATTAARTTAPATTEPATPATTTAPATTEPATTEPATTEPATTAGVDELPTAEPLKLGGAAWSAKAGFGAIWIQVDPPTDQIVKVDQASGTIALTVDGSGVAIAPDALWVAHQGAEVRKVDPATGDVLLTAPAPGALYLTVGAGGVWAPSPDGISRLDPATGQLVATITTPEATDLVATADAVWITHREDGSVSRIDPATNTIVATIPTGSGAHGIVVDDHGVWVTNYRANTVSRIDPTTNTVVATIDGVGSGVGIVNGDGPIYVSTKGVGISRIDPASNQASPVVELPGWNYGLAYSDGELWATNVDEGVVRRLVIDQSGDSGTTDPSAVPTSSDPTSTAEASLLVYGATVADDTGAGRKLSNLFVINADGSGPIGSSGAAPNADSAGDRNACRPNSRCSASRGRRTQ